MRWVLAVMLVVCAACADPPAPPNGDPGALDPADAALLASLPACTDQHRPDPGPEDEVEGLVLPPDGYLTSVRPAGALTQAEAWADMNPIAIRRFYQYHLGDLKPLNVEDEVLEAEVLMESHTHRFFVKAVAVCQTGSALTAVIGPRGDEEVPVPTGSPAATPAS
jgi:hypothetical protein